VSEQHIVCGQCGQINRLAGEKPAGEANCGGCHKPLFTGHPVEVDEAAFARHVSQGSIPVLVDVWAPWCGPCRMMAPEFERAAGILEPEVRLVKLNSDEAQKLAGQLNIRGIPTLLLMQGGREIARQAGAMTAERIVAWTRTNLGAGHA
jgi:thioredoxin 2